MEIKLAPEDIYELDTFTLEEKIQQIEAHPHRELFVHILQIAKLELIDRLQIQEFGRQLANDQYHIDLDFNLPPLLAKATPSKTSSVSKQTSNYVQARLPPSNSFITIGKPAVSHHYKPKVKPKMREIESNKPKQFLKAKKSTYPKPPPKASKQEKVVQPKESKGVKVEQQKIAIQKTVEVQQKQKPKEVVQQLTLKERLKKEVQEMSVVFRENDAYDDMKVVKMMPLNLKEEQVKLLQSQENTQAMNTIEHEIQPSQVQIEKIEQKLDVEEVSKELSCEKIEKIDYFTNSSFPKGQEDPIQEISLDDIQKQSQEDNKKSIEKDKKEKTKLLPISFSVKRQVQKRQTIDICHPSPFLSKATPEKNRYTQASKYTQIPTDLPLANEPLQKQTKSKSMKNFSIKMLPKVKNDHEESEVVSSKLRQTITSQAQDVQKFPSQQNKPKMSMTKFKSSRNQSKIPPQIGSNIFPYHQLIPSFQKLFPHSKNILVTLRNVEESLRLHLDKNIATKSILQENQRLASESDLKFKVIFESQKAKKHKQFFDIDLQSFYDRGGIMIDRIKGQMDEPQQHEMLFYRVVRTKEEVYDIVNSSFHRTSNWYELPHGLELKNSWNLLWTWSRPQIQFNDLFLFQKVNHFPGNKQIARKDLLKKNIEMIQKLGNKIRNYFDIIPQTFMLPGQNIPFIKKFRQNSMKDPLNYWILKPVGMSRGRGISLINKLQDVVFSEPIVLQKYLNNPLLLNGFKFDMRIYVLVTSINPLEAFIYKQGFARLSTQPYTLNLDHIDNKFIHLTNFSIQRQNYTEEKQGQTLEEELGGTKISLAMLAKKLQKMGISWTSVQKQIDDIVLKSLISTMNSIPTNNNCFQLFGYDVIMDQDQKCWLLEVNSSPSLEKQFTLDQVIKQQLVDDIMEVVNPLNYDRERLLEVVVRRRKEAEGIKSAILPSNNSVYQLDQDLDYILRGKKLRRYGQDVHLGNFRMVAPSDAYYKIVKVLQQYKRNPLIKKQ